MDKNPSSVLFDNRDGYCNEKMRIPTFDTAIYKK